MSSGDTELARLARRLAEAQHQLGLVRSMGNLGVWRLDFETSTVEWDEAMYEIMGTPTPTTPDMYLALVHPDDRAVAEQWTLTALETGAWQYAPHRVIRPSDGRIRWLMTGGTYVRDEAGNPIGMVGCVLDVTAQREQADSAARNQRLGELGGLAAGLAHNFNNMLATVMPALEAAREQANSEVGEMLEHALHASRRSAALIRQLMRFAGGQRTTLRHAARIETIIDNAVTLCRGTFDRRIVIEVDVEPELPHVLVDEAELEQTLVNLMMNARDALLTSSRTPPRVRLTARKGTLPPSTRAASNTQGVLISVEDNGPGVPPEIAERMFEPFFTTKPEGQGTGLGLSMAQRFVADAGGSIELAPGDGGGARFVLAFPITSVITPPRARKPVETPRPSLDGLSVLVVDDEAGVRKAVARLLQRMGATVHLAEGARHALEVASAQRPQIVLLDRTMPDGPGEGIIDELRSRVTGVIIVLFSGEPIDEDLTAHVDGYLAKPISSDELVSAIARLAQERRPPSA